MIRFGRNFVCFFFAAVFVCSSAAAEKQRDWLAGKVLDAERSRYFAGTVGNADTTGTAQTNGDYGTYQGHTNSSQTAVYRVYETFLIEGETHAYLAQERLRWRWLEPANRFVLVLPQTFRVLQNKPAN